MRRLCLLPFLWPVDVGFLRLPLMMLISSKFSLLGVWNFWPTFARVSLKPERNRDRRTTDGTFCLLFLLHFTTFCLFVNLFTVVCKSFIVTLCILCSFVPVCTRWAPKCTTGGFSNRELGKFVSNGGEIPSSLITKKTETSKIRALHDNDEKIKQLLVITLQAWMPQIYFFFYISMPWCGANYLIIKRWRTLAR